MERSGFDLDEFTHRDGAAVRAKLARFAAAGAGGLHLVLDFDRTLTYSGKAGEVFTWTFLEQHMPPKLREEALESYRKYRPLEMRGELTDELASEWWNWSFDIVERSGLNFLELEREFVKAATIRPGTRELFDWCTRSGVPAVILSAGIMNIIEMWCRKYGLRPDVVLATQLQLNEAGVMTGWDRDSVIHNLNKREQGHAELSRIRAGRPHVVLLGDSLDDAAMADGKDDVLRVRIYHPRPDEHDDEAARAASLERFDLVIEGTSLMPLVRLMRQVAER